MTVAQLEQVVDDEIPSEAEQLVRFFKLTLQRCGVDIRQVNADAIGVAALLHKMLLAANAEDRDACITLESRINSALRAEKEAATLERNAAVERIVSRATQDSNWTRLNLSMVLKIMPALPELLRAQQIYEGKVHAHATAA